MKQRYNYARYMINWKLTTDNNYNSLDRHKKHN